MPRNWTGRAGPDLPFSGLWDLEGVLPPPRGDVVKAQSPGSRARSKGSFQLLCQLQLIHRSCVWCWVKEDSEGGGLVVDLPLTSYQ